MITEPWHVPIRTLRPLPDFMRLNSIGYEWRVSPDYHFEGRFRKADRHAFFQYTFSGAGIFHDARQEYTVEAGKGFLCRAADADTGYFYPAGASKPWIFFWIAFDGAAALQLVDELVARHGFVYEIPVDDPLLVPFLSLRNASVVLPNYRAGRAEPRPESAACRSAEGLDSVVAPGERLAIELDWFASARMVSDLLLGLGESCSGGAAENPHVLLAHKAQRLIRDNLAAEMNATQLADALAVSREHLTRVFREQTGMSPYSYILRQKILRACRFLKVSELSQKEIAAQLGFSSLENFSRAFKRMMKLTPGQYRLHGAMPVE